MSNQVCPIPPTTSSLTYLTLSSGENNTTDARILLMLNIVTPEVIVDHQEYGIATKMSKKSILDAVPPRIFVSPGQQRKTRKFSTGDAKLTPGAYHM